jgi:hypothetical protein
MNYENHLVLFQYLYLTFLHIGYWMFLSAQRIQHSSYQVEIVGQISLEIIFISNAK